MTFRQLAIMLAWLSLVGTAVDLAHAAPPIRLVPVVSGLSSPVFVTTAKDGSNRLFIVEQAGVIKVLQPGSTTPTVFLNIASKVLSGGEQGLLGLTFHPDLTPPHRFFVYYTRTSVAPGNASESVVAEYKVSTTDPNVADPTTETVRLVIGRPFANHNGGMVEFGPVDGFLYIGSGDGGSGNDPGNRAQNLGVLLGKIIRIDVNVPPNGPAYVIPPTNPFVGSGVALNEIYAYGLRNPWRFSFDRGGTHQLYVADVGQGAWEEIDIVTSGGNYGWRVFEGTHCTNIDAALCSTLVATPPIVEYGHTAGRCSVTGGYVYRGSNVSLPLGSYVYADYCTGEIFVLESGASSLLLDTSLNISAFGQDELGELYVVGLGGSVSRIARASIAVTSVTPSQGLQGATVPVAINGGPFVAGVTIDAGAGIAASNVTRVSDSQLTATLTIGAAAAIGTRPVTATNPDGTAGTLASGFTVMVATVTPTTITATPSSVNVGGTLTASWSGITSPTGTDWIGLYLRGAPDTAFMAWLYVNCTQTAGQAAATGTCAFPVPATLAAGSYELRLFSHDGYGRLASSGAVSVSAATLSVSPSTIPAGGFTVATWSGIPNPTSTDSIGLYAPGAADTAGLASIFVSCTQTPGAAAAAGTCGFGIPGTLAAGTYQLRLFSGGTRLATSGPLVVTPTAGGPTLGVGPASVTAGGSVTVAWNGIAGPTATDWVGLYVPGTAETAFLAWIYASCSHTPGRVAAAGTCAFAIPATLVSGNYELRLFGHDGFGRLATTSLLAVVGTAPSFGVSPTTTTRGAMVTVTWSGIPGPSSTDWIGLYAAGAADTAYLAWIYVSCTQTPGAARAAGSCAFTIPSGLTPGTYQLRLFVSNSFSRLATSNSLTVN